MAVIEYEAGKGACMKNRIGSPRAALAALAVVAVTLGLSTGVASASTSVARPASSATATTVTKIHETKCTGTTLSVRYGDAKKVACYTGQGVLKVALAAATEATAGSSGGFLSLREGAVNRFVEFFPRERLPLAGRPEVTGIILSSLRAAAPKADSADQSVQTAGQVGFTVDVVGDSATLTAASSVDATLINDALAASVYPDLDGGSCHSFGWQVWKDYCEWTFTHAQSERLVRAAVGGGRAAVALLCTGLLHKVFGELTAPVCTAFALLFNFLKKEKLSDDQCIELKIYLVPPHGGFAVVKC
jgi:hypothetical protein